jgi:hypothetical protein
MQEMAAVGAHMQKLSRAWTPEEEELLRKLAAENWSYFRIAGRLKRTPKAVQARAHLLRIPLARHRPNAGVLNWRPGRRAN